MKLLWIDVESTGLDPKTDGLIQVAGMIEIDGKVVEEFNIKMRPFKGENVHMEALAANGVRLADLRTWQPPERGYEAIKAVLDKYVDKYDKADKFYAVGQNVQFDLDFVRFFFVKNKDYFFGSYVHYHKIDLIAVTTLMKLAGRINVPNMKLETVMEALNIGKQTHDALDDIKATRKIFYTYIDWVRR